MSTAGCPQYVDLVVWEAFKSLTFTMGDHGPAGHYQDRGRFVESLEILRDNGHSWTVENIVEYALAEKWSPEALESARKFAADVDSGVKKRVRRGNFASNVVDHWRSAAGV